MSKFLKLFISSATTLMITFLLFTSAFADGNKAGIVTADSLNVRETPATSANILSQLYTNDQVTILETSDGWYKISNGNLTGWVKADYVNISSGPVATITGDSVNLRSEASLSGTVISKLNYGDKVSLINQSGDWFNVSLSDGTSGWVFKDYITTSSVSRGDSIGSKMISFAKDYLGVRYVYGGSSSNGFDCSGFVKKVYSNFGIEVERVAADQANQGTKVSKANLRAGDLVFFDTDGGLNYINHVGIYMGDGQFIHASSGAGKVMISNLSEGFYANSYITARTFTR
ncbi:MAG: hypothetical protein K0R31_732 [Clostridiales bacterium]|jgi:cell wall-associated NlpC family hydrolase|nr:hypothetical protein [Clostridiales bacterium]